MSASQTNFFLSSLIPAAPNGMENAYVRSQAGDPTLFSFALARTGKVNNQTGTSYTVVADDRGKLVTFSNTSSVGVTLPAATSLAGLNASSTLASVFWVAARNLNTGVVSIAPSGCLIDGRSSLTLAMGQGAFIFWDGTNYAAIYSAPVGGVNYQSGGSYSLVASDREQLVAFTSASGCNVTLPTNLPPRFACVVMNYAASGSGAVVTLTPSLSGNTVNTVGSLALQPQVAGWLFQDSSNNWVAAIGGAGSGSGSTTFGGDLQALDTTHQKVIGIVGVPVASGAPVDGQILQYNAGTGHWEFAYQPIHVPSAVGGKPAAGRLVFAYTAPFTVTFPANFASPDSVGHCDTNPAASATYTFYKNGVQVGTLVISTSGVFTFATTGGVGFTLNKTDTFEGYAPGSQDTNLANVTFTLVGTRGLVSANLASNPVVVWKGAYSGGTTYSSYEMVSYLGGVYLAKGTTTGNAPTLDADNSYWWFVMGDGWRWRDAYNGATAYVPNDLVYYSTTGSTYLCIADTTGNVPTNATYWKVIAAGGASGGVQVAQDIGNTTNLPYVVGIYGNPIDSGAATPSNNQSLVWSSASNKWVLGSGGNLVANYLLGKTDATLPNAAVWPALLVHPDIPPTSPDAMDDEFDSPVLNTKWTKRNLVANTSIDSGVGGSFLQLWSNYTVQNRLLGITQSAPSTNWRVRAGKFSLESASVNFPGCGLIAYRSASDKWLMCQIMPHTSHYINMVIIIKLSSSFVYSSEVDLYAWPDQSFYMEMEYDGTNITWRMSKSGVSYQRCYQEAVTTFLGGAPDHIGVGAHNFSNTIGDPNWGCLLTVDWFRRVDRAAIPLSVGDGNQYNWNDALSHTP